MLLEPTGPGVRAPAIVGAHAFDPMGGWPMKELVVVPAARSHDLAALARAAVS